MKTVIRKMGNSHGVIIPKPMLHEAGLGKSDHVDMKVVGGKIVITPLETDPRELWAQECKAIREAGEDSLIWPEFGNEDDDRLNW